MIKLVQQFIEELDRYPVEDGVSHPAEVTLQKLLGTEGVTYATIGMFAAYWTGCWWDSSPYRLAQMIHVVGRNESLQQYNVLSELLHITLKHPSTEVRDAVVRTIEHWELKEAVPWLRDAVYVESTQWLKNYMGQVIENLEPTVRVPKKQPVYIVCRVYQSYPRQHIVKEFLDVYGSLDAAKDRIHFSPENPGWLRDDIGWYGSDKTGEWRIFEQYIEH